VGIINYNTLVELASEFGYSLSVSGAETYRVEDTVTRILSAYGVESQVFAIPNYLIVSIKTDIDKPVTGMRRVGPHGTNLDAVEKLNALSRSICSSPPAPEEALKMLKSTLSSVPIYGPAMLLAGNFLGAAGFALLFGCGAADMLLSGFCGFISGLALLYTDRRNVNFFFSTIIAAFFLSMAAYSMNVAGIIENTDGAVIGALMTLVPGLLFTNAMRDIIYGDTNSGINRIMQVIMCAMAIALGTAVAWNTVSAWLGTPDSIGALDHSLAMTTLGSLIGCVGFSILFNIHGPGGMLCALGGMLTWVAYSMTAQYTGSDLTGYFWASVTASVYAEIMARIRKYPTISYLVVSLFPLMPGAGVYYTMYYAVHGNMDAFASKGTETAAVAGVLAVGVMMVSTIVRLTAPQSSSSGK